MAPVLMIEVGPADKIDLTIASIGKTVARLDR